MAACCHPLRRDSPAQGLTGNWRLTMAACSGLLGGAAALFAAALCLRRSARASLGVEVCGDVRCDVRCSTRWCTPASLLRRPALPGGTALL